MGDVKKGAEVSAEFGKGDGDVVLSRVLKKIIKLLIFFLNGIHSKDSRI